VAKLRVLICDDKKVAANQAVKEAKLGAGSEVEIEALYGPKLADAIKQVSIAARSPTKADIKTAFDSYDIVICDDNLSHLNELGVIITAESIIGYIRAFTKCGYIVSLNKNPNVDFDLDSLFGDPTSVADLAINTKHLRIPALWDGSSGGTGSFVPWYWPSLKLVPKRRRAQIAEVRRNLDKKIFGHLKFTKAARATLSDRAIGALTLVGQRTAKAKTHDASSLVTFRSFFRETARTLPSDDRIVLLEQKRTDVIARVVASELEVWLRRDVLAPQDVLADAPHLLMRMPFLLGIEATKIDRWNSVVNASREPFGISAALYKKHLKKHRFKSDNWLERPAFWWPDLKLDRTLAKRFFGLSKETWGDFVFCEDTRRFKGRLATNNDKGPQEFASGLGGPWSRRYVERLPRFDYAPLVQLAR